MCSVCVRRHLRWERTIAVCFGTLRYLPGSPREKFRSAGATGRKANPPPPHCSLWGGGGWGGGVLRSLRLRSRGEGVSRWLLILQDEAPGPRRWERAPPLCGLAPLGGGGGSVSGPARRGPAVGRAGWSQEAGVQGRGHWRARQVLWQTHVRQPCFCSVGTFFLTIVSKKEGKKKPLLICKNVIFCSSNHRTLSDWPAVM